MRRSEADKAVEDDDTGTLSLTLSRSGLIARIEIVANTHPSRGRARKAKGSASLIASVTRSSLKLATTLTRIRLWGAKSVSE